MSLYHTWDHWSYTLDTKDSKGRKEKTTILWGFVCVCKWELLSCVWLFVTPWTVAHQTPLSMGILQARILEWVAKPSSRGSSRPRDRTHALYVWPPLILTLFNKQAIEMYLEGLIFWGKWYVLRNQRRHWLWHKALSHPKAEYDAFLPCPFLKSKSFPEILVAVQNSFSYRKGFSPKC